MNTYDENFNDIVDAQRFADAFNRVIIEDDENQLLQQLTCHEEIWEGEKFIKYYSEKDDEDFDLEIEESYNEYNEDKTPFDLLHPSLEEDTQ